MTPLLQRGDFVHVTTDTGRTVDAMVVLASPNGRSIVLMFDAMIGGWLGQLAAFLDEDGRWAALDGMPLQISKR